LDVRACFEYLQTVRALMRGGTSIVLVTHHIHEIPPEVSTVVLLKAGRLLAEGPKKEVLTSRTLSALFEVDLQLAEADGWYHIAPP
jgi:iron complex transport system ATP-binding protein